MPRFLNTYTGEFEWHEDPTRIRYAILSHTWRSPTEGGEQSFEDVKKLQSTHPRVPPGRSSTAEVASILDDPQLSHKIKQACLVARKNGFRLIWIDSCCIDKSSSAELSEAINSMYELYRLSDVCYVYLADVPERDYPRASGSWFRSSRWHKRGWTLQELIAPEHVIFLDRTWSFLGTKLVLAATLEEITSISADILVGIAHVASVSVAQRMSWASLRETTRVEDRAYSLLGIFGVHLSPIYGEGSNAFFRLQEEIIKMIPDQSIFAWGASCTLHSLVRGEVAGWINPGQSLLASSPRYFSRFLSSNITVLSPATFASRLGLEMERVPPLHCVFTPQGVRVQLLCIDLAAIPQIFNTFSGALGNTSLCDECMRLGRAHMLALLQCEDSTGSLVALPLCPSPLDADEQPSLVIATHNDCGQMDHEPFHTVRLTRKALSQTLPHLLPKPVKTSLLSRQLRLPLSKPCPKTSERVRIWPSYGIRPVLDVKLAPWCVTPLGFTIAPLHSEDWIVGETMIGQTTLSTSISFRTGNGLWAGLAVIHLQVVLSNLFVEHPDLYQKPDTEACFTIKYSLDTDKSEASSRDAPTYREQRTSEFNSHFPFSPLANVEFLLHFRPPSNLEEDLVHARVLRAGLQLPSSPTSSSESVPKVLWLYVEISKSLSGPPLPLGPTGHANIEEWERPARPDSPDTLGSFWSPMPTKEGDTAYRGPSAVSSSHYTTDRVQVIGPSQGGSSNPSFKEPTASSASYPQDGRNVSAAEPSISIKAQPVPSVIGDPLHGYISSDAELSRYTGLEILQRENEALPAQTADLAAQVAAMTSQNAILSSQMTDIFSRLDALQGPKGRVSDTIDPATMLARSKTLSEVDPVRRPLPAQTITSAGRLRETCLSVLDSTESIGSGVPHPSCYPL